MESNLIEKVHAMSLKSSVSSEKRRVFKLFEDKILRKLYTFKMREAFSGYLSSSNINDQVCALSFLCALCDEAVRLALIINLMRDQGMRIGEVINLKCIDYDLIRSGSGGFVGGRIKIRGKGRKLRIMSITKATFQLFEKYESSSLYTSKNNDFLFQENDRPLYYKYIQRRLSFFFGKNFKSHDFRRAFATRHSNNGVALSSISHEMGHSSLTNTVIYDKRSYSRIKRDFIKPNISVIDSFPVGFLNAGAFLCLEQLEIIKLAISRQKSRVIFELCAFAGLRTSEIIKIKRRDFSMCEKCLSVGDRIIPLSFRVVSVLSAWVRAQNLKPTDDLFNDLTQSAIKTMFNRISKKCGVVANGKILRASFIVAQLNRGVDPISLSFIIGTKYDNVSRYIPLAFCARSDLLSGNSDFELM